MMINSISNNMCQPRRHYRLGESTFIIGASGVNFNFYVFSMKFVLANRFPTHWTPQSVVSHLGLSCLPIIVILIFDKSCSTIVERTGAVGSASDFGPRGPRFDPRQGVVCCDLEQVAFPQLNLYICIICS